MTRPRLNLAQGWLPENDNATRPQGARGNAQLRWDNVRLFRWLYGPRLGVCAWSEAIV